MSAAAPRRPARTGAVAGHYLRLLARERGTAMVLLPIAIVVYGSVNSAGFAGLALPVGLAFFFPLYQWRGGGADPLDQAMPLDAALHRRVRAACGAAWAALALAACTGLYIGLFLAGQHGLAGFPAWYPAVLYGWALAAYLFGAALWLRAERPGRVLTLAWLAALTVMGWLPEPVRRGVLGMAGPAELRVLPGAAWVGACALALALGWAALWFSASAGTRPGAVLWARRGGGGLASTAATPPARTIPARAAGPRRPAAPLRVLRRELALVGHDARWALGLALLTALQAVSLDVGLPASAPRFPLGGRAMVLMGLTLAAFFWPLLVWMDDRGAGREWAEAVPAGMVQRRLLRVVAGAAWLELLAAVLVAGVVLGALRAGVIASPADVPAQIWAGFPLGVLMIYLVASIPLLLSSAHPVRRTVAWFLFFTYLVAPPLMLLTNGLSFSPAEALYAAYGMSAQHWGRAMLVWAPLIAAAAVAAITSGVASDRRGDILLRAP